MTNSLPRELDVIDSHTGGEPTRVVIDGVPDLGSGSMAERRERLRKEFDELRRAVILEPRGSDVLVGAVVLKPSDPSCNAGTIYFNNAGYLGMCGHGTIGLMVTLHDLGRLPLGSHRLETPVGIVDVVIHSPNKVSLTNVPSYRYQHRVRLNVPGIGEVLGDIAYGGNWFFLMEMPQVEISMAQRNRLLQFTQAVRDALDAQEIRGADGACIDHVELSNDQRNFVLCPGGAYDRSPCGTGTSAKLACLAAEGRLNEGETWRQESVTGSVFEASFRWEGQRILPTITGKAYITGRNRLRFDPADPLRTGMPTQ